MARSRWIRCALTTTIAIGTVALAASLAGCTPSAGSPPVTQAPTTSRAPDVAAPTSRVALDCSELVSLGDLGRMFTDPMQAVNPAGPELAAGSGIPATYFVRSAGGVDCSWSNGKTNNGGATIAAETATVTVLPDAAADWAKYRAKYHLRSDRDAFCSGDSSTAACYLEALVNGYWITADFENVAAKVTGGTAPVPAVVRPVFAAAAAKLGRLPASTGTPSPATTPVGCDRYLTPGQAKSAIGTTATLEFGGTGDTWSVEAAALRRSGAPLCTLTPVGADQGYGYVAILPDGAWGAADALSVTGAKSLSVGGLKPGDSATAYVSPTTNAIVVDLVVRGTWIEIDVVKLDANAAIPAASVSPATSAVRIARDIVRNLG